MKYLTLETIKAHLRIDYDIEDAMLTRYGESAEDTTLNYLNMTYEELIAKYTEVPAPVLHATLLLVDIAYQHHNPVTSNNMAIVPYTFDMLVKPYVIL